ncbi:MAG: Flp pilus assembly protein CpaB [Planctomycetaceae bacterium]|nr:Flp pilus assembly protein CpaB [Planctomycetaceae bacterium]
MKNQTVVLLAVAGACGLVAMFGVKKYLDQQNNKEQAPKVTVLRALTPIKQGAALNATNTQLVSVEKDSVPDGVVTDMEQVKDRSLKVPRGAGDWILVDQLSAKGELGVVTAIPKGYRVQTIPVDATTHHSGMLQPGNRIDLFVTYQDIDKDTRERINVSSLVLEYVEVFAVDSAQYGVDQTGENDKARNISLLVTPEQLHKVNLAMKQGDITTVLRSTEDTEKINIASLDENGMSGRGGDVDTTSSQPQQADTIAEEPAFDLSVLDEGVDMMASLMAESNPKGGSGPVNSATNSLDSAMPADTWIMAIHENGAVRVEHVSTVSDIPIDTTGNGPALPGPAGVPPRGGAADPGVLGPGSPTLEGLEDSLSDLIEEGF